MSVLCEGCPVKGPLNGQTPELSSLCVSRLIFFHALFADMIRMKCVWSQVSDARTTKQANHHSRMHFSECASCGNAPNRENTTLNASWIQPLSFSPLKSKDETCAKLLPSTLFVFVYKRVDRRTLFCLACGRVKVRRGPANWLQTHGIQQKVKKETPPHVKPAAASLGTQRKSAYSGLAAVDSWSVTSVLLHTDSRDTPSLHPNTENYIKSEESHGLF